MRLIYLLLFIAPQVLLYLYLRERLPDPTNPRRARLVRGALAAVFAVFNFPWIFVASRVLFGSVWGTGTIPYLGPWIAWQLMGWGLFGLVALYVIGWVVYGFVIRMRRRDPTVRPSDSPTVRLTRRQFLARATYAYAGAGAALSSPGARCGSPTSRPASTACASCTSPTSTPGSTCGATRWRRSWRRRMPCVRI